MIDVIHTLDQLRAEGFFSDYAIGGGIATLFYTEPFATVDVDVFALIPSRSGLYDLSLIYARLRELGCAAEGAYVRIGDQPVQLLVPPTALEEEAVREAEWRDVDGVKVKVFRPEYLVATYLRIGRPRDRAKIAALLEYTGIDKERLQRIIQHHGLQELWNRYQESVS
jgi:predicted nucleotidyltransferase